MNPQTPIADIALPEHKPSIEPPLMTTKCSLALAAIAMTLGAIPASADTIEVVDRPDMTGANPYYPGNKEPLLPSPYIRLSLCLVKPQGWLAKQLQLQADGFHGHLGEISGFLRKPNNAWLDPAGKGDCFWEEVPYWLRGYAATAFLLDDPALVAEARAWLEPSLAGQRPNGYFGTEALSGLNGQEPDLMPHLNMLYAYRSYYDYSGDKRILELMTRFFHYELTLDDAKFFRGGWGVSRNSDNMDMVYWLYNRTGDPQLLELGAKLMRTGQQWLDRIGNPHFPALRSDPTALSGASPRKQTPSSQSATTPSAAVRAPNLKFSTTPTSTTASKSRPAYWRRNAKDCYRISSAGGAREKDQ